jgi:hypothetical protein
MVASIDFQIRASPPTVHWQLPRRTARHITPWSSSFMQASRSAILLAILTLGFTLRPGVLRAEDAEAMVEIRNEHGVIVDRIAIPEGRCGAADFGAPEAPRAAGKGPEATIQGTLMIPVAFHVISKSVITNGTTSLVGDVSTSKLDSQIKVLNKAFGTSGIQFFRSKVDRTTNNNWFVMTMGSAAESAAKKALTVDPLHTLNIYTTGLQSGQLGYAYYPWSFAESSYLHGLVMHYATLPGGSMSPYNKGDTAVHEIGHYLALYHTFQNGCAAPGDYISDTPDEATPAYGNPTIRDTCPSLGLDPIHNYMDYVDDVCMYEFSSGQRTRMAWTLRTYKTNLGSMTPPLAALADPTGSPASSSTASNAVVHFLGASPNPFNPTTAIRFSLAREAHVTLRMYDVAGHEVARLLDGTRPAGENQVVFEGRNLASGVYMALLRADDVAVHERIILTK